MAVEYITIGLGSNEEGIARREAFNKAAEKENMKPSEWLRWVGDKACGFKGVPKK